MTRTHIDYGIDLGTTNSCIALFENGEAKVLKNTQHRDYTQSAVYFNRDGAGIVGESAKDKLDYDAQNAVSEFKLQMGSDWEKHIPNIGRSMTPEEFSAEVLKALKGNLLEPRDDDINAAVITVPAAFGTAQSDATSKAARLAGILHSPLLQEPVAAALAYGFDRASQKTFWLVYDFGGGTFDAAVIKPHDGIIQVVNHGGDNHLGGKLFDWAIVDELLVPEVRRQADIADFGRDNLNWRGAIAKLKRVAEEGKIRLSNRNETAYEINEYLESGDGKVKRFEYVLRREQIEPLAEPYIRQSINICKQVMAEAHVQPGNVEQVLLVGGPTLMPYLRERLEDPAAGLGIALEYHVNPMTVVAQGAAIFAATEANPVAATVKPKPGQYRLTLDHQPIGNDPRPLIGGEVVAAETAADFSGYRIEFINNDARIPWRSGVIPLSAQGSFTAELWAPDKNNIFLIELTNPQGGKLDVEPNSISYTLKESDKGTQVDAPLTHSIGVALANNEVAWFFKKGASLPCEKNSKDDLHWAYHFRRDQAHAALSIPIVEGENQKADRNQLIGSLKITADDLKRDIRAGEEVEVEIKMDKSRLLTIEVYTAALHKEKIKTVLTLRYKILDAEQLSGRTRQVKNRLEKVKEAALATGDPKALSLLNDLDKDGILQEIAKLENAADADPDARDKWEKKLRELDVSIDDVEDAVEIPFLVADAQQALASAQKVVEHWGTEVDRQNFQIRQRELLAAVRAHNVNPEELRRKIKLMDDFAWQISAQHPEPWIDQLTQMEKLEITKFTNLKEAGELLAQGRAAVHSNDFEKLRTAVRQLWQLLNRKPEGNSNVESWVNRRSGNY